MSSILPDVPAEMIPMVAHVMNRIYQLLPIQTQLPVYEVEDDTIFLDARKALIHTAQSNRLNDIVQYSVIVLNRISEQADNLLLKQRTIESLSSTLIILRLLADLTKVNWDSREPSSRKNSIESNVSNASITSSTGVGFSSYSVDYHTVQPSALDPTIASRAIQLISKLKSTNALTHELAFINGKSVPQSNLYEDLATKPYIDQIDVNCETILRFFAATNPVDFFNFTVSKLSVLKHNVSNDGDFAPYLELFASIYLNEHLLLDYLKHIRVIISTIRKSAYRQLILSFFLKAIKIWIHARPHEFLNCSKADSNVSMEADSLFDEILSLPEGTKTPGQQSLRQFKTSYTFLAFLLTLHPKTLEQYLHNESKSGQNNPLKKLTSFSSSNKKLKVLSNIVRVLDQQQARNPSDNIAVLESLEFIALIADVAGSIYRIDHQNIVVEFTLGHYSLMSRALVPISSSKASPLIASPTFVESQLLTDLRLKYYSNICILNPKELVPQLVDILNDEHSTLETLNITTSTLRVYSAVPSLAHNNNQNLLVTILPSLRRLMIKMSAAVKTSAHIGNLYDDYDDTASLGKTTSSSSSEYYTQFKSMVNTDSLAKHLTTSESVRSQSNSSSQIPPASTPKSDKLKESTKSFFRHRHTSSHTSGSQSSQSQYQAQQQQQQSQAQFDDARSIDSRDNSIKFAVYSREILINAFGIFKKFPQLYLASFTESTAAEKVAWLDANSDEILDPLITALNDSNFRLAQAARGFVHSAFTITNIPDDLDITTSAFAGTSVLAYAFAKSILETYTADSKKKENLEYFVRLLESRITLQNALIHHTYFQEIRDAEKVHHEKIGSMIEELLIFGLCTCDLDTYSLIKRGMRAHEKEYALIYAESSFKFEYNKEFFLAVANDSSFSTGIVALQKNIRKHLLKINTPTFAIKNVWNRIYEKWAALAESDYSELSQAELNDFRNFAGFLASTSGIFVGMGTDPVVKETFSPKVESFLSQQLKMLKDDSLVTRENAREILAAETNPGSYPVLIRLVRPLIDDCADKHGDLAERDLIAGEHLIILLKAVLEKANPLSLYVCSVNIIHCADTLTQISECVTHSEVTILKLKVRLCQLFQVIEAHSDTLVTKSAYKERNKFLRFVFKWFDEAVTYHTDDLLESHEAGAVLKRKDLEYIYVDLALESAKALSGLLDSLILESPQAMNKEDLKYSNARIFNVYFSGFLKALEKFSDLDQFSVSMKHKLSQVTDFIVLCLTNLLKANVEVGLVYALPIGYHSNCKIRVSFLKVFVSILQSYTISKPLVMEEKKKIVARLFKLLLSKPSMLSAIGRACPPFDAPALASFALSLANRFNQSANLVSYLIEEEIHHANSYTDILRRNSFASRSLSAFGRTVGNEYLVSTLRPILTEIRDSEADLEVEKLELDDPRAEENLNNFMHYLKKLVNVIISSEDQIPLEFKKVCQSISKSVEKKFPNYRQIAVGSFIFLRFFCPAIVSPESENLVDIPNRQIQRKFLLLAKVVQNMANGSVGTLRWPILKAREGELYELNDKLCTFLDSISILDSQPVFEVSDVDTVDDAEYSFFHSFAYENWGAIRAEHIKSDCSPQEIVTGKAISEQISGFLTQAGQPSINYGFEMPPSITPESNSELYEFMSKYSAKDMTEIINNPFIRQDISQDGSHLYVFTYRDYMKIQETDDDLVLCRMFQVASKIWDHKFNMVIDCTGAEGSSVISRKALGLFRTLAPHQMQENCQAVYYYNVSSSFYPELLDSLKKQILFSSAPNINYHFISALDDKKTVLNLGLSNSTVRSFNDVRVKFTDASLYQPEEKRFVPIILRIGNESLQIHQTTPQRLKLKGVLTEIYLNDVYELDQVKEVKTSDSTTVPNEITISFKDGRRVILSSPKYLEVMRLLYFSGNRALGTSSHTLSDSGEPVTRLLGKVFNVIFMSLTSSSSEVRSIAYNLLAGASNFWKLDFGKEIIMFHEAYFPRDNNSFVISMSEKLAQQMPEITTEFISAFFNAYSDSATSRQRLAGIMYISPWIKNIYNYVYKKEDEHGADYVTEIIRNFLNATTLDPLFLSTFNVSVWSKLCLVDGISSILVNEIVLAAIDREAEGSDWRSIIALLASNPTVEICSCVIRRLRNISNIPFPDDKGNYSIISHSNWIEITVLVEIAVSLMFDNQLLADMFLPDVFYVITVLVDVGPLELRIASHQLLLNLLQSFLSKKTISESAKTVLRSTVEHFTSPRSKVLFGLNRDTVDDFKTEVFKFSSRISTIESLVASLLEVTEVSSSGLEEKTVWISRWNRYILDAAVKVDSVLSGRALLLLGLLSKTGVDDHMVTRILEMIGGDLTEDIYDSRFLYLAICSIFSLSRISEGLNTDSVYFSRLFWLAISITHSQLVPIYQGGLQFISKALEAMHIKNKFHNGQLIDYLFSDREILGSVIDDLEAMDDVVLAPYSLDQVLCYFAMKGLQLQHTKASSISALKMFFQIRYSCELQRTEMVPGATLDQSTLVYLLFLFILLKPTELRALLDDIDVIDEFVVLDDQSHLPKMLLNFLLSDSDASNIALLQAAIYFNDGDPNDKSRFRFLQILRFIGDRNPNLLQKVYHEIRPEIRRLINHPGLSPTLITEIFHVAALAYTSEGYDEGEAHGHNNNALLNKYKIGGIRNFKFPPVDLSASSSPDSAARPNRWLIIKPLIRRIHESRKETD